MFGEPGNPQWKVDRNQELVIADYAWEIGKIGSDACVPDGQSGWIAFNNTALGYAFTGRFAVFPGAEYPDHGATVECWTVGKGKVANLDYEHSGIFLMEAEVLSPFYTFQPGESRSFQIKWGICRTAGRTIDVQPGGCSSQKLSAQGAPGEVRLTGSFGVFDTGELWLTWMDAAGEAIGSASLGRVGPENAVDLDEALQPPDTAAVASLSVVAEASGARHHLGKCDLSLRS